MFEETKGVSRNRKSKKDRQHNCQPEAVNQRRTDYTTANQKP